MSAWRKFLVAGFSVHFLLISMIGLRDIVTFVARGYTWLPGPPKAVAQRVETALTNGLERLRTSDPLSEATVTYVHLAGIESGYAFFAPNVPDNYKLVFELHYPDGRIEYDLPHASNASAGFRLATLVDNIGRTDSDDLREVMVKMMAYSAWQAHPEAAMIRAVIGFANLPTASEFARGVRESDKFLYAYEFTFPRSTAGNPP